MDDRIKSFWAEWTKADELKRRELVEKLNLPKPLLTLINSYFEDLYDYMEAQR